MGLGNLKKNDQDIRLKQDNKKLDDFLGSSQVKTGSKKSGVNYVRASYSITKELKEIVLKLSKKISIKCSESDVVKLAISELNKKSLEEIEKLIVEIKSKN